MKKIFAALMLLPALLLIPACGQKEQTAVSTTVFLTDLEIEDIDDGTSRVTFLDGTSEAGSFSCIVTEKNGNEMFVLVMDPDKLQNAGNKEYGAGPEKTGDNPDRTGDRPEGEDGMQTSSGGNDPDTSGGQSENEFKSGENRPDATFAIIMVNGSNVLYDSDGNTVSMDSVEKNSILNVTAGEDGVISRIVCK